MADDAEQQDNDVLQKAIEYQTINTTGLFDRGNPSLKISRSGVVNIRIQWAAIIWGGIFGVIALFLCTWILFKILHIDATVAAIITIATIGAAVLGGGKLGTWSPMSKDTGENLVTYLMIMMRSKLARGGMGDGKQSETMLYSKAVVADGQLVNCKRWIGTQPLRNAPPMDPHQENYMTRYRIIPLGEPKVVKSEKYQDGLGDRF